MTSPDATSKPAFLGSGKQPKWADDKGTVPSLLLPNGERAEVIASIVLAYDATLGDYVVVPADHSTGALTVTGGGGGGGGAATIADGADVAEGTTTDVAVQGDNAGTVSAKLRGLNKSIAAGISVDASGHAVPVTDNSGSLTIDSAAIPTSAGQKAMSASLGVVVASDQTQIPVYDSTDKLYNGATALTPKFAKIVASSSGVTNIVAAVTSKKLRVLAWSLVCNAAVNVKWQSHVTPTDLTGLHYFAANGGISVTYSPLGYFETVSGEALDINLSGAVAVGGSLVYVEV